MHYNMAGKKGAKRKQNNENSKFCKEYYKKYFPELSDDEIENKIKWYKKSCNYLCLEYYERKYPELTHEEHVKMKENAHTKHRQNNKFHLEYWVNKYPELSKEEQEKMWHDHTKTVNYCCVEYYERLGYSKEGAIKERDKRIKEMGNKVASKLIGELNPMHHSKTTKEERESISPRNIKFYERKYPELTHEEHIKLKKEFIKKNNLAVKNAIKDTNIEYYLNQGYSLEESKQKLKERQATFSLEKCIEKYGEIEGTKRFNERQQKWLKSLHKSFNEEGDGRSPQSKFANDLIKKCCKRLNIEKPKKEKYMYDNKNHHAYAYDFTYNKKIIEFQGDYWHCNPNLYDKNFYNKVKKKTAGEIWKEDYNKKICAEKHGYKILYVWEYDYNKNPEEELNKCINFLIND